MKITIDDFCYHVQTGSNVKTNGYCGFLGTKDELLQIINSEVHNLNKNEEVVQITADSRFVCNYDTFRPCDMIQMRFEPMKDICDTPVWQKCIFRRQKRSANSVCLTFKLVPDKAEVEYKLTSIYCSMLDNYQDEPPHPNILWRDYYAKDPKDPRGANGVYNHKWDDLSVYLKDLERSMDFWKDKARVVVK